ncbi:MAG TPA: putative toxin-antitoxin system toxin component, PIN family [Candidatus Nanoarchaeia archaeon]|nr:putative toxin-antitoxin system toxin component, PIN family [Candidatus Nanoarchaeia archaeon]
MGKKRIVIDTNVFISALGWGGKPNELIERVIDKEYELYSSIKQIKELKKVLDYPKLNFSEDEKKRILEKIYEIANIIDTKIEINAAEDPDDNMLLECAAEADADCIISGDDDLRKLKKFKKVRIMSVGEFLKENELKQ